MSDRVNERRRAAQLARHYREQENLTIAEIARRLGREPATVKAYLYDPTGEKARAVKARYLGVCRGCGAYTQPRKGKGNAYAYCKRCHPGAIERRWTGERVIEAMCDWRSRYGRLPSSYDWSRTHARRRGGAALRRLNASSWPAPAVATIRCLAVVVTADAIGDRFDPLGGDAPRYSSATNAIASDRQPSRGSTAERKARQADWTASRPARRHKRARGTLPIAPPDRRSGR
jgi:hypothetical protein